MLHEQVLVLHLNISVWGAEKTDRALSNEILEGYESNNRAGKFIKNLLGGKCAMLDELKSFAQTCRIQIRRMSLPYRDGSMLVPCQSFMTIMGKVSELEQEFNQKVEEFVAAYPQLISEARTTSRLINESEILSDDEVRAKFKFEHHLEPLPTNNCFDGLMGDQEEGLQEKLNQHINSVMERGKNELKFRLKERAETTLATLQNTKRQMDKRVPRKNLEAIELIRSLNITQDPDIEVICNILQDISERWEVLRDSILDRGTSINAINTLISTYY